MGSCLEMNVVLVQIIYTCVFFDVAPVQINISFKTLLLFRYGIQPSVCFGLLVCNCSTDGLHVCGETLAVHHCWCWSFRSSAWLLLSQSSKGLRDTGERKYAWLVDSLREYILDALVINSKLLYIAICEGNCLQYCSIKSRRRRRIQQVYQPVKYGVSRLSETVCKAKAYQKNSFEE